MASFARTVSFSSALLAVVGLIAANQGWVAPLVGFQLCIGGALLGGLVAVVLSLVAIAKTRGGRDPEGRRTAWLGLAVGLALVLAVLSAASTGGDAPPINDITTDLADPPAFASADVVADYAGRDMGYPPDFVEIVRTHYPTLAPRTSGEDPATAYARALSTAESFGWKISARDDAALTFDAQDTSKLFRFVDDVTVRVRPDAAGSRVDVRSKSRDGRGDMGANARRIERLLAALG